MMAKCSCIKGLVLRLASLRRDQHGISAVEFALILPLMIALYFGVVEVTQAVATQRKVTLTARTIADLASQFTSIKNADMSNMLDAAAAVIAPYDVGPLVVTVSAVAIDADGNAKVVWSDSLHGTPRAPKSTATVPPALNVPSTQLIWSEVRYAYTPTVGNVITGTLNLSDQIYMRPRLSELVNRDPT